MSSLTVSRSEFYCNCNSSLSKASTPDTATARPSGEVCAFARNRRYICSTPGICASFQRLCYTCRESPWSAFVALGLPFALGMVGHSHRAGRFVILSGFSAVVKRVPAVADEKTYISWSAWRRFSRGSRFDSNRAARPPVRKACQRKACNIDRAFRSSVQK